MTKSWKAIIAICSMACMLIAMLVTTGFADYDRDSRRGDRDGSSYSSRRGDDYGGSRYSRWQRYGNHDRDSDDDDDDASPSPAPAPAPTSGWCKMK